MRPFDEEVHPAAMAAPTSGATRNSQTWLRAVPPTIRAGRGSGPG